MEIHPKTLSTELEKRNQLGGSYINGKPLPREVRFRVIQLAQMGVKPCEISRQMRITHGCISKLISKFHETGSIDPANKNVGRPKVITPDIELKIDQYRDEQPGIFSWELRERLIKDKICSQDNVPSLSSISRLIKRKAMQEAYKNNTEQLALQLNVWNKTQSELEYELISVPKCDSYSTYSSSQSSCSSPGSPGTGSSTSSEPARQHIPFSIEAILSTDTKPNKHKCASLAVTMESSKDPVTPFQENYADCKQYKQQRRHRMMFTSRKVKRLEREFEINPYPGLGNREELSTMIAYQGTTLQDWLSSGQAKVKSHSLPLSSKSEALDTDKKYEANRDASRSRRHSAPVVLRLPFTAGGPSRIYFPSGYNNSSTV